jgi:hypothetical protein
MRVGHSAYQAWSQRPQAADKNEVAELTTIIQTLFNTSRAPYGSRRLKKT